MSENTIKQFKTLLQKNNSSITKARVNLFQLLLNSHPLSMSEIINQVKSSDRASVYRNIDLFQKLGIINRVNIGWKYKLELSDKFVAHHHHLNCLSCNQSISINEHEPIEKLVQTITQKLKFTPQNHHFEIDGLCLDCTKKQ